MPRKKTEQRIIKYYMPSGAKEKIDSIVDRTAYYKRKGIWKQKFYYLSDYISGQNINNDLDAERDYVNINQQTTAKIIGVNNQEIADILRRSVDAGLFKTDGISWTAIKSRQGKEVTYIKEGKSCGYQFKEWTSLEEIEIADNRFNYQNSISNTKELYFKYDRDLKKYFEEVLSFIKIDEKNIDDIKEEVLKQKKKKKDQKENYQEFIKNYEINYKINYNQNYNKICNTIPFNGAFVPIKNTAIVSTVPSYPNSFKDGAFVPVDDFGMSRTVPSYLQDFSDGAFVPCYSSKFEIRRFQRRRIKIKAVKEETDQTTIARCDRSVFIINEGYMIPARPIGDSRVYTAVTNLKREFRKAIRLDDKKIVGLDIVNSQPLIASILIRKYWLEKENELPDDVKQYQADCEAGVFYENFMKEIDLPIELRPQFKADFFGKVFFSRVIEKSNVLKSLFIKRYPSCYEAVCDQKGGLYCRDYNEFANKLQKVEATIIFNVVNMELIRQGIKAFNIFDSIYVNSRYDLEVARDLLISTFKNEGINPTIKVEYEEQLEENERVVPLGLQHQDEMEFVTGNQAKENEPLKGPEMTPAMSIAQHAFKDNEKDQNIDTQEIKEDEMKKKYTVDELLNSKESKEAPVQTVPEPSKLAHLKIESKEDVLRRQAERLAKSIQQADAEDELAEQLANPLSEKQIYDFAVDSLKSQGRELSKKNIDDATKLVRHEVNLMISNEKNKVQPYKFVNPYTR